MSARDVGDQIDIRYEVRDADGDLTAATVSVAVTQPDGTLLSPAPVVSTPSVGIYDAGFVADQAGPWRWTWTAAGAVTDVSHGQVDVGDPSIGTYATLSQLRSMPKITTSDRDALLQVALSAAARGIDGVTGRRDGGFYRDSTSSARQYEVCRSTVPTDRRVKLLVDEIGSTDGLTVETGDGTTWTAVTGHRVDPLNALADRRPITGLTASSWGHDLVRVTARWGWPAVPDQVVQATLILALRLYGRKDSPTGIAGDGQMGVVRLARADPDVMSLVGRYELPGIA
ncbi:hypothetical protein O7626_00510 [Micromonospora sp. WMMD1102]|uniref:hypothetical protein n=1 Tax=Micromonospora sp. WMMD1102 TaxID=3016105 RepID=UPI00241553CA|nr:hypothetical protein [Micromonospora sp. WMMD1102]MDG4784355.1 hypothetical protein [Micromonospora sp. WMMD1102]MDG4784428.1 hypothetical protein [Micromonospora sp. WMMD1102]